eukprot:TRINITY_DN16553_c0_g1_i4.p1 TRINITY_DN16553_c0_g1~~TRINITY_DN16553_c0_g1_i4.p1  ORF type:complete len:475 (+),score=55.12 TRINITY_DN16553_c0_g1_i4:140-1426(+)
MSRSVVQVLLVSLCMFIFCQSQQLLQQQQVVSGINNLGFKLMDGMCDDDHSNCVLSPFSIHSALAMTARGAQDNTRTQIMSLLDIDLMITNLELDEAMQEIYNQLILQDGDGEFEIANGIFVDIEFPLSLEYELALENSYNALAQILEFQSQPVEAWQLINDFVITTTQGQISDLIPKGAIDSVTRVVLVNALFYKGIWETVFNKAATSVEPFYVSETDQVMVPTMYVMGSYRRGSLQSLPQVSFIELPYSGGEMSMFIIIPKSLNSMSNFQDQRSVPSMDSLIQNLKIQPDLIQTLLTTGMESLVELYMPKFTIEFSTELSDVLQDLGVTDAFTQGVADFGGMLEGDGDYIDKNLYYLSEGYHKAKIVVDEEGTTAAAATGLLIAERSAGIEMQSQFIVDQPFVFMLVNKRVQTTLVMGVVSDPTEN